MAKKVKVQLNVNPTPPAGDPTPPSEGEPCRNPRSLAQLRAESSVEVLGNCMLRQAQLSEGTQAEITHRYYLGLTVRGYGTQHMMVLYNRALRLLDSGSRSS